MTLGQKIRALRKERGLTQAALCKDYMTRNMLSQIENDSAAPSLPTVCFLAKELSVPVGYLLDEETDPLIYRKAALMGQIRAYYSAGMWQACIDECKQLSDFDDELALLLADCYLQQGASAFAEGKLDSASHLLDTCLRFCAHTCYPKSAIEERAQTMMTVITQVRAGTAIDPALCVSACGADCREEFLYNTLLGLIDRGRHELAAQIFDSIRIHTPRYRKHLNARFAQAAFNYPRAASLLWEIVEEDGPRADALFCLRVYGDLENSCKAMSDYEGAYRAANAKNQLTTDFHS